MKKATPAVRALIFAAIVSLCLACTAEPDAWGVRGPSREVKDDLGRSLVVPDKIERAISLAPSITEMIFAIGAGDKLVGVTSYCNYPQEATAIAQVGDTQTPNIERIIALQPQVVFISTASQLEAFRQTLAELGIAVYVTNPRTLDDVFRNMTALGDLFGRSEDANAVVSTLAGREKLIRQEANLDQDGNPRRDRPRVFVQISKEPLFTIGKDSFLTEIVALAGGSSVTGDIATAYPKISKEAAARLQPDVILLSDSEDNSGPSEVFRDSPATRNSRVYRINADIISRPGPRLVDALEEIARKLRSEN